MPALLHHKLVSARDLAPGDRVRITSGLHIHKTGTIAKMFSCGTYSVCIDKNCLRPKDSQYVGFLRQKLSRIKS